MPVPFLDHLMSKQQQEFPCLQFFVFCFCNIESEKIKSDIIRYLNLCFPSEKIRIRMNLFEAIKHKRGKTTEMYYKSNFK